MDRLIGEWVRISAGRAAWAPLLVFGVHCVLSRAVLDAYEAWPDLDVPMHLLGGLAIAHFASHAARTGADLGFLGRPSHLALALLVLAATGTATVLWEFGEFSADALLDAGAQKGLPDTMLDMALGLAGGVARVLLRPPA
jgi:hypothetical protein